MIKYIENLLPKKYHEKLLSDAKFKLEYGYREVTSVYPSGTNLGKDIFDVGQFVCTIYNPLRKTAPTYLKYYDFVQPVLFLIEEKFNLEVTNLFRIKFNLLLQRPDCPVGHYNLPHVDTNELTDKVFSCLYYLNDSDGDTVLFNELYQGKVPSDFTIHSRYKPKANSALLFESGRFHSSSAPRITPSRHVINFVFSATLKSVI